VIMGNRSLSMLRRGRNDVGPSMASQFIMDPITLLRLPRNGHGASERGILRQGQASVLRRALCFVAFKPLGKPLDTQSHVRAVQFALGSPCSSFRHTLRLMSRQERD
jgi:hypothetical protein